MHSTVQLQPARLFCQFIPLALASIGVSLSLFAAEACQAKGKGSLEQIADGVYAFMDLYHPSPAAGTNAGLILTGKSAVFIDAGMTIGCAEFMWEEASKHMKGREDIYLILTHHHSDHVFGMRVFEEKGAEVISHAHTKDFLEYFKDSYKELMLGKMGIAREKADSLLGDVVITIADSLVAGDTVLEIDGEEIHLLYTPGHVPGEMSVYYPKAKVLFAGDTIYAGVPPTTAFGGPDEWRTWIDQLNRLKELDVETIVPGHGGLCGLDEIDKNIEHIEKTLHEASPGTREEG